MPSLCTDGKISIESKFELPLFWVFTVVPFDCCIHSCRPFVVITSSAGLVGCRCFSKERKYLESFEMWCWRRMEKIKWSEKVTNKQVLDREGEKRTLLNNILRRKANWIGHILRRNCLLHDAIEGQMTKVKGVGRRRTQLLDDLRNRRWYWELKEEAEGKKRWRRQFISSEHKYLPQVLGPANKQHTL